MACSAAAIWDGTYLYMAGDPTTINGVSYRGSVRRIDPATGAFLWQRGLAASLAAIGGGAGRVSRIVLALQLETEIRTGMDIDPGRRADRFVERWQKLERTSQHHRDSFRSTRTSSISRSRSTSGCRTS